MENKLLSCPFCGIIPKVNQDKSWITKYYISCENEKCEIICETGLYETIEEAIGAWNNRIA